MAWDIIHIIDILLWIVMAGSVLYVFIFSLLSLFHRDRHEDTAPTGSQSSFLILYPAYHEDAVIVPSVKQFLEQDYPQELYHVAVISDHMSDSTNDTLRALPITLLTPTFEKSSKAKALQYAIRNITRNYDYVIILDADNLVLPDFLAKVEQATRKGYRAIQCHRCAKNSDNSIAVLDGVSEEINNSIFRRAHNVIGLSSALIGSGMCFDFQWFKANVNHLSSAVEDRELEVQLMKQNIFIKFEESIRVFDEKVNNQDNFQKQRLRWMTGQVQSLINMLPYLPKAIIGGNINYIDKAIQQALIPRSMLLAVILIMSLLQSVLVPEWCLKWWGLFAVISLSLFCAMPASMRKQSVFGKLIMFPSLVWRMILNINKIDKRNKDFIHTTHQQ